MPAETWRRLAKATVARRLVTLLVLVVLPVGSQSVLDVAMAPPHAGEPGWRAAARLAVGAAAVAGTAAILVGTLRRDLRRRRIVAAHDGRVHPRSLGPLSPGTCAAADARTYWWTWLVTAESPAVFAARTGIVSVLVDPDAGGGGTDHPHRPRPTGTIGGSHPASPPITGRAAAFLAQRRELVAPGILLLVVPGVVAMLADGSVLAAAILPAAAFLAFTVVRCVPWLTVAAELPLKRCRRCDQPLTSATTCCPECGNSISGVTLRAARPRPARRVAEALVAAIGLCWLVVVLAAAPLARAIRTSSAVPSSVLLADLSGAPDWDEDAFRTLVSRGPEPAIAAPLARVLNQRRRAGVRTGPEAWSWFDAAIIGGVIDGDHEHQRWRDSVEPLRLVRLGPGTSLGEHWGGAAMLGEPPASEGTPAGPGGHDHRETASTGERLSLRFIRRFDGVDGRRSGLVIVGLKVGDGPWIVPRWADGDLVLVSAGVRPSRTAWLPKAERFERPWPAPPEYVLPLPPLPADAVAAAVAGEPVRLDVLRYVSVPGAGPVGVAWGEAGPSLQGEVTWQARDRITLGLAPDADDPVPTAAAELGLDPAPRPAPESIPSPLSARSLSSSPGQ